MRIVILTQYFLPEMGAPQSRLYELSRGLKQLGWEVSVVTAMPNYPTGEIFPAYRRKFVTTEFVSGILTRRYWLYASNATRSLPRIMSMLSFSISALFSWGFIRKQAPDYLMVESPPLTLAFSGWVLSVVTRSKLIMNVSDLWPLSARELGAIHDGFFYRRLEQLESFLYRKAFLCTGQSQEIVEHIRNRNPQRVYLFRNGVDVSRFSEDAYDPARRHCLVYAGLLGVAQGILSICEHIPFRELGVEFHIYGSGSERLAIEDYVRQHADKGIRYMGIMPRESVPKLLSSYGGALIALVRNIHGAVPSKIYEAMAAGLPILFSGSGEGANIVLQNGAGWVSPPGEWNSLKDAIARFGSMDNQTLGVLRNKNRALAIQHFNRDNQIGELEIHLKKLSTHE